LMFLTFKEETFATFTLDWLVFVFCLVPFVVVDALVLIHPFPNNNCLRVCSMSNLRRYCYG
jgi:hypothetical protein